MYAEIICCCLRTSLYLSLNWGKLQQFESFGSSSNIREWPILSSGQEEKYDEGESCNKEASSPKCECEESHLLTWQKMTFVNF